MDHLPMPAWRISPSFGADIFNQAWLRFTGRTLEQELGEGWLDNVHPEDRDHWRHAHLHAEGECRLRRHDGAWRWMRITVASCPMATRDCDAYLCVCHDVTDLRRYQLLSENARDIILFIDPEGRILEANDAAVKAYGYSRAELLSLTIYQLRAPETRGEVDAQMHFAREHGILFETVHRRKDGSLFPVEVSSRAGSDKVLLSIVRDIRDRRRAEADLRLARFTVERSGEAIFWVLPDGRFLDCNEAGCKLLGYSREETRGLHIWDCDPDLRANDWAARWNLLVRRGTLSLERPHRRKDGAMVAVEINVSMLDYEGGRIACAFLRDISERQQAEQELRRALETVRALVNFSPLAIVGVDADGFVNTWNPAAVKMFGWEESEVRGRPYPLAVTDSERAQFRESLDSVMRGIPFLDREVRRVAKDGRTVHTRIWAAPIQVSGEFHGAVAVLMDVGERKLLEEQLRQAQRMEAIGFLAGGLAHDFNNLLTIINGHSAQLQDQLGDYDHRRKSVDEILGAGQRAAALIRQLLAFSRRQPQTLSITGLNTVVSDLRRMLGPLIGEDVELITCLDPALCTVKADPTQMEQVLMNLAVNARDAMPDGGKLTVRTANVRLDEVYAEKYIGVTPGEYVLLAVSDTGVGMDAATKARIFEPFFTTKEPGRGTGLGLATVYGIVQQSGGHIAVSTEPGRGTTFRIYLPVAGGPVAAAPAPAAVAPTTGSETILLVEDEEAVRAFLATVLGRNGYRVIQAANGAQALAISDSEPGDIHLLLTDLVMPGMNGAELARRVEKLRPGIRVLYVSGYTDHGVMAGDRTPETRDFLQKPFSPADLCGKVRRVLDA